MGEGVTQPASLPQSPRLARIPDHARNCAGRLRGDGPPPRPGRTGRRARYRSIPPAARMGPAVPDPCQPGRAFSGRTRSAAGRFAVAPASLVSCRSCWRRSFLVRAGPPCSYPPRGGCRCLSRRIQATSGRRRRDRTPSSTVDPKPRHACVAATALVCTSTPVPARPAAAGGGAVSARAIPGSMRPTPPDWPGASYTGSRPVS